MARFLHLIVPTIFATTVLAWQSLSTLNIDWAHGPQSSNLGFIDTGARVKIAWDVSGDPSNLALSILLKRNTTQSSVVAAILAAGGVPNNGSFFWDVQNTIQYGGGYYIRLQTGNSSDWGNGTNNSPPTPKGVYGLAGHFSITPPSTTTSRSTARTTSHPTSIRTTSARPTTSATTARVTTTSSSHVGGKPAPHAPQAPPPVTSPSRTVTAPSRAATPNTPSRAATPNTPSHAATPNTPSPSRPTGSSTPPPGSNPPHPGNSPAPSGGNPAPPGGSPSPSGSNPAPSGSSPAPPGSNPAPSGTNPAPSGSNPAPPGSNPAPSGTNPAPSGSNPAPPGSNPAPPGSNPAPSGSNPAPPGSNPAPSGSNPAPPGSNPSAPATGPAGSVGTPTSGNPPSTGSGGNPGSVSSQTAPSTPPPSTTSSPTSSTTVPSPILSSLSIGWGVPTLNNHLGSIITGTNVNIVWDSSRNTANLPMSILLKQGSTSEGGQVVSIPAPKNVPNNGLFVWHVDNSLPPGSDYYIRVQTGTSDDWDGGLNTSMPTPGAIYGLAGLFTLNSTSNAAASATVIATHFVTCCTGGSSNARRSGIIAGSVLGGVIALGFLAALGWWATKKAPPVAGTNPAQNRKFSFTVPPPILALAAARARDGFDPAQLTLLLKPIGFANIKPIAWQVFTIDGRKPQFTATLPPDRGFGDANVEEDHNAIAGILYARVNAGSQFVPPGWMTVVDYDSEVDQLSFKEPSDFSKKRPHHIAINNRSEVPHTFILGSYHMNIEEGEELQPFQPFGMVEDVKEKLVVPHALHLQVYLTYNVRVGQVMTDHLLDTPLLRPAVGVKVADLEPGTTINWTVRDESGSLSIERT